MVIIGAMISVSWPLTGTLKDNINNPLSDAEVYLVKADLRDSTDASGKFSFSDLSIKKGNGGNKSRFFKPMIIGSRICFNLAQKGNVEYRVYSITGSCVYRFKGNLEAGEHQLPLIQNRSSLAKGVYAISFKSQEMVTSLRYNSVCNNSFNRSGFLKSLNNGSRLIGMAEPSADSLKIVDTLIITKVVGEVTSQRKIKIYDYKDDINSSKYISNGLQMVILDPSNDNDADGLTNFEERYVYFTNSELFDTDGDGLGDNAEIKDNTDPRIANYPQISFRAVGYPTIMAHFSKAISNDSGMEISSGGDYNYSSTFSTQQQVNANVSVAIMAGLEISKEPKLSGSITTTAGAGYSITWGDEHSASMARNWNNAKTITKSEGVNIDGGEIILSVELTNNSSVNITLVDPMIRLTATDNGLNTLGNLIGELTVYTGDGISGNNEVYIPFAAGSNTATRKFRVNISNPDILEQIAKNSYGFRAQLTNIRFKTSLGEIDTLMANVYRRTAEVMVDFGQAVAAPNNLVKKRVASRAVYNDFYTNQTDRYISTNLLSLLKITGVTPVTGTENEKSGLVEINGIKNGTLKNGNWSIVSQITSDSLQLFSTKIASYDPASVAVGQATIISCIYDSDIDGDGLSTRIESVIGTNDSLADSDGDSLSDKEEFVGWHRASDPANEVWRTNPLRKDSDQDSLNDPVDPDPLAPVINVLDSVVSFSSIQLTSLQGTPWIDTIKIRDTVTAISTNSLMRGPAELAMKLNHPVFSVSILCKNSADTIRLTQPDSTGYYKAKIGLTLGDNEIVITAISRNGAKTKKVQLSSIQRRLARINQTKPVLFKVESPAILDYAGIGADVQVNVDSMKLLDPLIQKVFVLRTDIYACPVVSADKNKKIVAQNLGDAGDGKLIEKGKFVRGLVTDYLEYRVVDELSSGKDKKTNTDTIISHMNDLCYFAYTYASAGEKLFISAPVNDTGTYFQNERTIIIDSVSLYTICRHPWGLGTTLVPYVSWSTVQQTKISFGTYRDSVREFLTEPTIGLSPATGVIQETKIRPNQELVYNSNINFAKYVISGTEENSWRRNDAGTWRENGTMPAQLAYNSIVAPETNAVEGYSYSSVKNNKAEVFLPALPDLLLFNFKVYDGFNEYLFDHGFNVHWHYKYNPLKK
jgi:hypothetical protein